MIRPALVWCALALLTLRVASAQEREVVVVVVQIAGADLYLNVGSEAGIRSGDTVAVRRVSGGEVVGAFAVRTSLARRALVGFAGTPFAVTRGDTLYLSVTGVPAPVAPSPAEPGPRRRSAERRSAASSGVQARGHFAVEFTGTRTTTFGFGASPEQVDRDFAAPAVRFRTQVSNLPGGVMFAVNLRGTYRSGLDGAFDPATSVRVYEAKVVKAFTGAPLQIHLGRFYNPYERYSGYWDGALLRLGGAVGLAGGALVGFEPKRADEAPTTNAPKYGVFVSFDTRGRGRQRYHTDFSFHQIRPRGGQPIRTAVGWSQRFSANAFRLTSDLELGRSPVTGDWAITRLYARGSIPLGGAAELYGGYVRDRPDPALDDTLPATTVWLRDRGTAGLSYRSRAFYLDLSGGASLVSPGERGYLGAITVGLPQLAGSLGVSLTGSYWHQPDREGVLIMPAFDWRLGGFRTRLTYQFAQNTTLRASVPSHSLDLGITLPLPGRIEWVVRGMVRRSEYLRMTGVFSSLQVVF